MDKNKELLSWSAKQAIAILAVGDIEVSRTGLDILRRVDCALITHKEARQEVLTKAKTKASANNKLKKIGFLPK